MEYEFINDPITGGASAKFSLEHEVMGPWLEVEVGSNTEKLTSLLTAIEQVDKKKQVEVLITGHEYSVIFSEHDVTIQTNASMNGVEVLPDSLIEEDLDFDASNSSACGIDDFRTLLLSWAKFTTSN
jgi:uncharacterized protein YacL (UPF0231 family)